MDIPLIGFPNSSDISGKNSSVTQSWGNQAIWFIKKDNPEISCVFN